jgi:two-component system, NarL family, invasion response regulator UvrY
MRILLADDHTVLRQGLRKILARTFRGARFGEAGDTTETLAALAAARWDLLILDISMPGRDGFEVLRQMTRHHPQTPVLVLSSTPEEEFGMQALRAGAAGYLNKRVAAERIAEAARCVCAGGRFFSSDLLAGLVRELRRDARRTPNALLSRREMQVARAITDGKTLREIAAELTVSAKTISTFRSRLFAKLGVKNDAQLVRYCQDRGVFGAGV